MSDEINQSVVTSQTTSLDRTSEVVSKINKSSEIKTINLDDETESNFEVVNKEQRKNLKLYIAGFLAISLWITLIITIAFHFYAINQLAQKLASVTGNDIVNQATYIKEAIAFIN